MTREEFTAAVEKMRAVPGGRVELRDFYPGDGSRMPYRYAQLVVEIGEDFDRLVDLARLTVEVQGHMSFWTHYTPMQVNVNFSRILEKEERRDVMPDVSPASSKKRERRCGRF